MRRLLPLALFVTALGCGEAGPPPDTRPKIAVLMIGNSYTGYPEAMIRRVAKGGPVGLELTTVTPGGKTLLFHAGSRGMELVKLGGWKVVVLQEQSQHPAYSNLRPKYLRGLTALAEAATKAKATPLIYATWGYRDGDVRNRGKDATYTQMQDALDAGFAAAAKETGLSAIPCNKAFRLVHARKPALFRTLYAGDGSHPSTVGNYLIALVCYRTLTGKSPGDWAPESLPAADATLLRTAAADACKK